MKILDFTKNERPRERLAEKGARALSDAELLAIILRSGTEGRNAVEVARELLVCADGSLESIMAMSREQLCRVKGIGRDKAVSIAAAMELGRRLNESISSRGSVIHNATDAYQALKPLFCDDQKEECWCLMLKQNHKAICTVKISEGTARMTDLDIKRIVRKAIDKNASTVILSHNHPSGDPRPSLTDIKLTSGLKQALQTFDLSLTDHIIIGNGCYYSFCEEECFTVEESEKTNSQRESRPRVQLQEVRR